MNFFNNIRILVQNRFNLFSRLSLVPSSIYCHFSRTPVCETTTLEKLHEQGRYRKKKRRNPIMEGKPQIKGVVLRTLIKKPKKPNSANRKCCIVKLSTGKEVVAYIPGIGHNLQEHHFVLVEGKRLRDVPGVKVRCVRGALDLPHVS